MPESPKAFLRRLAQQRNRAQLSEVRPDEIIRWCEVMLQGAPEQAGSLAAAVVRLDYNRLDARVVRLIESALYYAMIGEKPNDHAAEA